MGPNQQTILALFEQLDCGVYFKDELLRFTYSNQKFADYFGIKAHELIGKTIFDLVDRDLAFEIETHEKQVFENGTKETRDEIFTFGIHKDLHFQSQTMCLDVEGKKIVAKLLINMSAAAKTAVSLKTSSEDDVAKSAPGPVAPKGQLLFEQIAEPDTETKPVTDAKPKAKASSEPAKPTVKSEITNRRFLLLAQHSDERRMLSTMLSSWNFDFAPCNNVDEALAVMWAAREQGIVLDGLIVDYETVENSDIHLIETMQSDETLKQVPICLIVSDVKDHLDWLDGPTVSAKLCRPILSSAFFKALSELNAPTVHIANHVAGDDTADVTAPVAGSVSGPVSGPLSGSATGPITGQDIDKPLKHTPVVRADFQLGLQNLIKKRDKSSQVPVQILVAEDNPVNQIAIAQFLEKTNYGFEIAENGTKAFDRYEELQPDLVILDMNMPQMSGEDVAAAIRITEAGARRTIIIGMGAPHEANSKAMKCGDLDDFITKPIAADELYEKLSIWMPKNQVSHLTAG